MLAFDSTEGTSPEGATTIWARLDTGTQLVWSIPLGETAVAAEAKRPLVIKADPAKVPALVDDRVSLRVTIPREFAADWQRAVKEPTTVVQGALGAGECRGSGWRTYTEGQPRLMGFVTVRPDKVDQALRKSGTQGIFVSRVARGSEERPRFGGCG